jgi:FMN phosphatase YigB (HAD superfamily)
MIALFDIGSTLIDGPPYGPARRLAEMLGLGQDAVADLERLLFRTPSESAEHLAQHIAEGASVDPARALEECTKLWNAQLSEAYVLPGALEAVARLRAAAIPRAYLSNIWPPFYEHFRRSFTTEAAEPQFLSFQLGLSKPDAAFFSSALQSLAVDPSEVVIGEPTRTHSPGHRTRHEDDLGAAPAGQGTRVAGRSSERLRPAPRSHVALD